MLSEKFISATKERNKIAKPVAAPYVRKNIEFDKLPDSIFVTVCGLGFYDIFVNGEKITKGFLAPYISNPDDICYYDKYDILPYIKVGNNVIGFILGNGFKNNDAGTIWEFDQADFIGPPQLAFAIEGKVDEESFLIEADESVKVHESPIIFDDIRAGTHYDARLEIENWCSPDFDDSYWDNAYFSEKARGAKKFCEAEPITVQREIKAVSFKKATLDKRYDYHQNFNIKGYPDLRRKFEDSDYEGYCYDFGENTSGVPKLRLYNTKPGQKIELQMCEFLNNDGNPTYMNLTCYYNGYVQRDIYICKGADYEEFTPAFTFHGFRYVFINGLNDEQAREDTVAYLEFHSDFKSRGSFVCSDETVNKLQDMVRRSDRSNFIYFPTDCPHREKNGWTGDATVSCEQMLLNYTVENSLREWLFNVRAAQNQQGTIPGIVPTAGWGFAWGNGPIWDNVLIELPYQIYRYTGNLDILKENFYSVYKYLGYASNKRNEKGLLCYGLGDWVKPRGGKPVCPKEFIDSIMIYDFALKAAKMFEILDKKIEEQYALQFAKELKNAIKNEYVDEKNGIVANDSQTAYVLALYLGIIDNKVKALENLLKDINEYGMHDCGMIGIRYLFHVLSKFGYSDLAYELIVSEKQNGYGNFVKEGFTTIPEAFTYRDLEGNISYMSLNHHFLGDISHFFISEIAGIHVNDDCTSAAHIDIKPQFISNLNFAKSEFDSVYGKVEVSWGRQNDEILLSVRAGDKICGNIVLPDGFVFTDGTIEKELKSGQYNVKIL
ncbi:MAG: hypothetical protein E7568_04570 [Ruminococcaceae bacterium]|nr:hypothetical protein [Oscillospiraceae bacterium]